MDWALCRKGLGNKENAMVVERRKLKESSRRCLISRLSNHSSS